jgi:hypothetical protein
MDAAKMPVADGQRLLRCTACGGGEVWIRHYPTGEERCGPCGGKLTWVGCGVKLVPMPRAR